jgi:uncharacterized protein (TIGR00304 family)
MLLLVAGLSLILLGLMILLSGIQVNPPDRKDGAETKGGAVVMIGPIPVVLASDARMATVLMLMALAIMIAHWLVG